MCPWHILPPSFLSLSFFLAIVNFYFDLYRLVLNIRARIETSWSRFLVGPGCLMIGVYTLVDEVGMTS